MQVNEPNDRIASAEESEVFRSVEANALIRGRLSTCFQNYLGNVPDRLWGSHPA